MKKISLALLLFVVLALTGCEKETLKTSEFIDYSKQFTLDQNIEGKSFLRDGIGKVEVVEFVDGDTARFKDISLPQSEQSNYINMGGKDDMNWNDFRLRFLGVDTPETYTNPPEDFGLEGKNFTNTLLKNAKTIVLSSVGDKAEFDTYGRLLGLVWVDGVSVNVELIQNGYSNYTSVDLSESKRIILTKVWNQAREFKLNIHSDYK